jgi:hypothetical protein
MRPWTADEIKELLRGREAKPQVSYKQLAENLHRSRNSIQNKFWALTTNHPMFQKPIEKEALFSKLCLRCRGQFMAPKRLFICQFCKGRRTAEGRRR